MAILEITLSKEIHNEFKEKLKQILFNYSLDLMLYFTKNCPKFEDNESTEKYLQAYIEAWVENIDSILEEDNKN